MNHQHQQFPHEHHRPLAPPLAPPQLTRGGPVIRPSPIPANAPTEQELLAEMAMRQQQHHHPDQQQFRMPGHHPGNAAAASGGVGGGVVQPSREEVLCMAARRQLIPELLKTAEAISLQTAVQNGGMNMLNTILYQFVYGQMEPRRREILLQVSLVINPL